MLLLHQSRPDSATADLRLSRKMESQSQMAHRMILKIALENWQRSTAQHSTAQRSTAQHSTAQHSTAQQYRPKVARAPPREWPVQMTRVGVSPPDSSLSTAAMLVSDLSGWHTAANCCRKPANTMLLITLNSIESYSSPSPLKPHQS